MLMLLLCVSMVFVGQALLLLLLMFTANLKVLNFRV